MALETHWTDDREGHAMLLRIAVLREPGKVQIGESLICQSFPVPVLTMRTSDQYLVSSSPSPISEEEGSFCQGDQIRIEFAYCFKFKSVAICKHLLC